MNETFPTGALRRACAALLLAASALSGLAQAAGPALHPYQVQPGDSLYSVAAGKLQGPADWPRLAQLNPQVRDPQRLQPGSMLQLPVDRLRGTPQPVIVVYARGEVVATAPNGAARAVATGDLLHEGEMLRLGADSYASLRLHDGSQVHVQEGSVLRLLRQRSLPIEGGRQNVLELERGRVDSTVTPQAPGSRFDVRTPRAVAGVRGTRFGVAVLGEREGVATDVIEGRVAFGRDDEPGAEVGAGQGAVQGPSGAPAVHPLLPAPQLAPQVLVERLPLTLAVGPLEGAAGYRAQIARDARFTQVLHQAGGTADALKVQALDDGDYFVAVRGLDRHGLPGAETVARLRVRTRPVPPLAQGPGPDAVLALGRVEFSCTEVPRVEAYLVQVSRDADFARLEGQGVALPECRWSHDATQPGRYHWRAASMTRNAAGELERGPFSDAGHFEAVKAPAVPQPQLVDGPDDTRLHWAAQPGARFVVEFAADADFERPVQRVETVEPQVRVDLPPACHPHYVRLRSIDVHGLASPFSPPRRLPAAAVLCTSDGEPLRQSDGLQVRRPDR